jgi:hypothetical protein
MRFFCTAYRTIEFALHSFCLVARCKQDNAIAVHEDEHNFTITVDGHEKSKHEAGNV